METGTLVPPFPCGTKDPASRLTKLFRAHSLAKPIILIEPIGVLAGHTGKHMNIENGTLPSSSVKDDQSNTEADTAINAIKNSVAADTEIRDKQLRARIKLLGNILGKVIKSQVGKPAYDAVEKLRTGYLQLEQNLSKKTIQHYKLN